MSKYLIVIKTQCPKTPEDELRRMVRECFAEGDQVKFSKLAQVLSDKKHLPVFEILVDSDDPPFGKLPKYVLRLARA